MDEQQRHPSNGQCVLQERDGQQCTVPGLVLGLLVATHPRLGPRVAKVYDQHQLDDDKGQATDQAEPHPGGRETALWNEEGADCDADDDQEFESPEAVLDGSAWIAGAAHAQHDDGHQGEEAAEGEADAVHGQIAHGHLAVEGDVGGGEHVVQRGYEGRVPRCGVGTEGHLAQRVLQAGGQRDGTHNGGDQHHEGVHEPGGGRILAGRTRTATARHGSASATAGELYERRGEIGGGDTVSIQCNNG